MADQATIKIITLDASEKPSRPTLELIGRAMPYQGLELEGSMTAEFTWYPGNAVASIQMLGAKEAPSRINGMWKDKFLKQLTDENVPVQPTAIALFNNQPVASVIDLCTRCEEMRLAGQLIRFEWGPIARVGIIRRFKQRWIRFEDVEWEMEFEWASRGEQQTAPSIPLAPDANSFANSMQTLVSRLKAAMTPPSFQVVEEFLNTVNAAVEVIDDAALEMSNAVANATSLVTAPQDASARALAASESIKESASTIVGAVEGTPPLELIKTGSPQALGLGDALVADTYSREIKASSRALQAFAAAQGDTLRASLDQDTLLAAFVARAPMDLRDVSQRYYNTPDQWRRLLSYNARSTSALAVGDLVLVPKLNQADGRA